MNGKALVHLKVEVHSGLQMLKQKIYELKKISKVVNASSVYRRVQGDRRDKETFELVVVLDGLERVEDYKLTAEKVSGELLFVEGELRLDPHLTLPNPNLQMDPFLLFLAAECAPYWEHRVRKKSLSELSRESKVFDSVEFLTQGQALINV